MPVSREDSVVIVMEQSSSTGVREAANGWQLFRIDSQYIRISTSKSDLGEAKQAVSDSCLEYKFRQKNGVPVVSKWFSDVANCASQMNKKI